MGQTGVILCFWFLFSLLLLLEPLIVLGGNRKPYTGHSESPSDLSVGPPYGSHWGHKNKQIWAFWLLSPLFIVAVRLFECIGRQ